MADEKVLRRLYPGEDANMIGTVRNIYNRFVEDLAAFNAFDTTFTAEWAAQWKADIDAAYN